MKKPRGIAYFCIRCLRSHHPAAYPAGSSQGLKTDAERAQWDAATSYLSHKDSADGTEKGEAIRRLRGWIKPGDLVYTVLRRRSSSGMTRHISVLGIWDKSEEGSRISDFTWNAAKALGCRMDRDTGGLVVGGCRMDMGYHLVYNLGRVLYQDIGFKCIGEKARCLSNAHSNGEGYTKGKRHSDAGYSLRHSWL